MKFTPLRKSSITLLVLSLIGLFFFGQTLAQNQSLQVDYLDVGQGDAVLVRTPDGKALLYDAGRKSDDVADQLTALGVKSLDLVVMSHADADHIGGMSEVVLRFKPRAFLSNDIPSTTQTYDRTLAALTQVKAQGLQATDRTINLGNQTALQVLPPERRNNDQNENSVGILLRFGSFRMVLSGDAEPPTLEFWMRKFAPVLASADVYKAAHHGSKNNDNKAWLELLKPQDVIVSAGAGNSYGHPAPEALTLYRSVGATVWRTDLDGRISFSVSPLGRYTIKNSNRPREVSRTTRASLSGSSNPTTPATPLAPVPTAALTKTPGLLGTVAAFGGTLYLYDAPIPVLPVGVPMPRLVQLVVIGGVQVHFYDAPMPVLATFGVGLVKLVSSHTRASAGTLVALQTQFDARVDVNRVARVVYRLGNEVVAESSGRPNFPATFTVQSGSIFGVASVGESNLQLSAVVVFQDSNYIEFR